MSFFFFRTDFSDHLMCKSNQKNKIAINIKKYSY